MPKAKEQKPVTLDLHYSVNVSEEDKKLIDAAAAAEDEPKASRWIRRVALKAARSVLGDQKER